MISWGRLDVDFKNVVDVIRDERTDRTIRVVMDEIDVIRFVVSDDVERYFRERSPELRGESVGIRPDAIGGWHLRRIGDCGGVDPSGDVGGDVDGAVAHDGMTIARPDIVRQRDFFRRMGWSGAKP